MEYRYQDNDTPVKNQLVANNLVYFPIIMSVMGGIGYNVIFDQPDSVEGPNRDQYMSQFEQTLDNMSASYETLATQQAEYDAWQNAQKNNQINTSIDALLETETATTTRAQGKAPTPPSMTEFNAKAKKWLSAVHLSPELSEDDKDDLLDDFRDDIGVATLQATGFSNTDATYLNECRVQQPAASLTEKPVEAAHKISQCSASFENTEQNMHNYLFMYLFVAMGGLAIGAGIRGSVNKTVGALERSIRKGGIHRKMAQMRDNRTKPKH